MDNRKVFKSLEILWLVGAIIGAGIAVYFLITKDSDSALFFVGFFVIASIQYLLRRYQRKNQEKRKEMSQQR
ncbi:MAG: hypothetical protein V4506_08910 [Bacteroidota bacterium]